MAVYQISRIQVRRGQIADQAMPQLASGEFGWAVDHQRLFIGNGSVAEGAPAIGNTEVLTEHSLFDLLGNLTTTTYTYRGLGSSPVVTGTATTFPIEMTLQQKLDQNVTTLDFGAEPNTDISDALQRALDEIYTTSHPTVPLRLPAGTYHISEPVYLPPYATLVGDGTDKTILISINTTGNTTVFGTKDSSGNVGLNITDTYPDRISVSGMTIRYGTETSITNSLPLMILSKATNAKIENVKFLGNYTKGNQNTSSYSAIKLEGVFSENIQIENCDFESLCYPIVAENDMTDVHIKQNVFQKLYRGISIGTGVTGLDQNQFGPRRVYISSNKFHNIERQAIFAGANTATNNQIHSRENVFIEVGNNLNGENQQATAVITFNSHGNSSLDDIFNRWFEIQDRYPYSVKKQLIEGTSEFKMTYVDTKVMAESTQTQLLFVMPYDSLPVDIAVTGIDVEYSIKKEEMSRKGTLSIVASSDGVSFRDSYVVAGDDDGGVVFSVERVDNQAPLDFLDTLEIKYMNSPGLGTGTCVYSVSYYR
jgi:hypothetical protein